MQIMSEEDRANRDAARAALGPVPPAGQSIFSSGLPTKIKLDGDLAKRLKKLNDKQAGVQQFVAMVTRQGEERLQELVAEGRQVWQDVAKRYGIDLERVQWNLDSDGETIVPVGMRLT